MAGRCKNCRQVVKGDHNIVTCGREPAPIPTAQSQFKTFKKMLSTPKEVPSVNASYQKFEQLTKSGNVEPGSKVGDDDGVGNIPTAKTQLASQGSHTNISPAVELSKEHGASLAAEDFRGSHVDRTRNVMKISALISPPLHTKSRTERPDIYPERFPVPDTKVSWGVAYPEYDPPMFEDPSKPKDLPADYPPAELHEEDGRPLNPGGRTGIFGRGACWKWGPNHAADPIITRNNPTTGELELLLIQRGDSGEMAFPGGMVDPGESMSDTAAREFKEECGVDLDFSDAELIYQGYVDDRRNTDNAWFETNAQWKHLPPDLGAAMNPVAGSDADDVRWVPVTENLPKRMYASHGDMLREVMKRMSLRG